MRYLGIDYGKKRIGVALSDPGGLIAFPYGTVKTFKEIVALVQKEEPESLVIGLPVPFGGRASEQTREVRAFAERLREAVQLPIAFENEVLTTKIARRHTEHGKADAAAAAIILQAYLDRMQPEARNPTSEANPHG